MKVMKVSKAIKETKVNSPDLGLECLALLPSVLLDVELQPVLPDVQQVLLDTQPTPMQMELV